MIYFFLLCTLLCSASLNASANDSKKPENVSVKDCKKPEKQKGNMGGILIHKAKSAAQQEDYKEKLNKICPQNKSSSDADKVQPQKEAELPAQEQVSLRQFLLEEQAADRELLDPK